MNGVIKLNLRNYMFFDITLRRSMQVLALATILLFSAYPQHAQAQRKVVVEGTVYEQSAASQPLKSASVSILPYNLTVNTDNEGKFRFNNIPDESFRLVISYVGKVTLDTLIQNRPTEPLMLRLADNSFRLENVDVVAKPSQSGLGSTSVINRNAIEHLQANSLADIMSLVPGGITVNPDLNNDASRLINIRSVVKDKNAAIDRYMDANAFGTSIVMNGSPISNNANLQTLSPVMNGGASALGGGAPPRGGIDSRSIPMYNVESVEVIRGVPGVKYGDLASGAVIVNQRAGRQPLFVEANTNPNLYNLSASKGIVLDDRRGAINLGGSYAYNTNDPVQAYRYYQRGTINALYSNSFFNERLSSTTGIDFHVSNDGRRLNPDDEITRTKSSGKETGIAINSMGSYQMPGTTWLRKIDYAGRLSFNSKRSYYQQQYTGANAAYGMTYTDGAILTNTPGEKLYNEDGEQITQIPLGEEDKYAVYLPSTYLGVHQIEGKELSTFLSATANFFNQIGGTQHSWLLGGDFRSDKNFGAGKIFADSLPPYRDLQYVNSSYRNRKYSDIPAVTQLGFYVEDNMTTRIMDRLLRVSAGLRYDRFSQNRSIIAPRANASFEILPEVLMIRAGYGVMAKAPSLLYLYPENAYFDYININEIPTGSPDAIFMTTTRAFNTENSALKIASNRKQEVGIDLRFNKSILSVTAFSEKLKNGYAISPTIHSFRPVEYKQYERVGDSRVLTEISADPVLAKFNMPTNNMAIDKQGLEFQLDLARIQRIRTQFSVYGAYIKEKTYSTDYTFYDGQSGAGAQSRTHIGLYQPAMIQQHVSSVVSTLKATHNIPKIGLAITLTTDIIWNESDWTVYGNDSIPQKYISKFDGLVYDLDGVDLNTPEFTAISRPVVRTTEQRESLPPLVNFNINLTKDIKDFMRLSFFANNLFRYYQNAQSDRISSVYYRRNIPFFFGFKVGVNL